MDAPDAPLWPAYPIYLPRNPLTYPHTHTPQLAFADRILLNKIDLVDEAELQNVEKRIRVRMMSL